MSDKPTSLVRIDVPVVMIFPAVITPKAYKNRAGSEAYSASFVLKADHPAIGALKASIVAVAKEKWPGRDLAAAVAAREVMLPFQKGDTMIDKRRKDLADKNKIYKGENDFMAGALVLKASTKKYPPQLGYWDPKAKKWIDLDDDSKANHAAKFYFGAEALVEINLSAYDKVNSEAKDGVTAYLQKVYVTGKGKRLVGGAPGSETFSAYVGHASDEDPTQGLDDEMPF
jgi:hypothetical protein